MPPPDGSDATARALKALHPSDNGQTALLPGDTALLFEEWRMYSERGKNHAKQYSWDVVGKGYEKWIKEALWTKRGLVVTA